MRRNSEKVMEWSGLWTIWKIKRLIIFNLKNIKSVIFFPVWNIAFIKRHISEKKKH